MAVSPIPASELKKAAFAAVPGRVPAPRLNLLAAPESKIDQRIAGLRTKRAEIKQGGGQQRIEKQHAMGKFTARERVDNLIDQGSFQEMGIFAKHRATLFGMAEKETQAEGVITVCSPPRTRIRTARAFPTQLLAPAQLR